MEGEGRGHCRGGRQGRMDVGDADTGRGAASRDTTAHAYVDRIEGDVAVLLLGNEGKDRVDLPKGYLPPGTREGDHLQIRFSPEPAARDRVKEDVDDLMNELLGEKPERSDGVME